MKKFVTMLLALVMITPVVYADSSKTLKKELEKEYKKKLKSYRKEKWNVVGSRTMEVALLKHYEKLNDAAEDAQEIVGMSRTKTKNNGYQAASNNARISYASQAGSALKGRAMTDIFADGANTEAEFDHFFSAYERLVEKEIRGEMQESFALMRTLPDGTYEFEVFYVVSESKAAKARQRALENAMKDSEVAQKYAKELSGYVNESFPKM